jgi:hypothetical protein
MLNQKIRENSWWSSPCDIIGAPGEWSYIDPWSTYIILYNTHIDGTATPSIISVFFLMRFLWSPKRGNQARLASFCRDWNGWTTISGMYCSGFWNQQSLMCWSFSFWVSHLILGFHPILTQSEYLIYLINLRSPRPEWPTFAFRSHRPQQFQRSGAP